VTTRPPKTPKLDAALLAAIKSLAGTSLRESANEAGHRFVTYAQVLAIASPALQAQGLELKLGALAIVGERKWMARDGEHTVWVWEQACSLFHAPSGESHFMSVQVTAPPHDWGADPPSRAAERLMLVRLLRLAVDDREPTAAGDGVDPHAQRTAPTERELAAGKLVSQLTRDLNVLKPLTTETLGMFWADAQKRLRDYQASSAHHSVVTKAFRNACESAGLDHQKVAAATHGARA
jgi:hypothetical protein